MPVKNDLTDLAERISDVLDPKNDPQLLAIAEESSKFVMDMGWETAAADLGSQLERVFRCQQAMHARVSSVAS